MTRKHKFYLNRFLNRAKKGNVDYLALTVRLNALYGTKYSVYQVAGYLGRAIQMS
jgi:hypothetical protein